MFGINCHFFTSAAYKSDYFGFMLYYCVRFPDEGPLRIETCSNITFILKYKYVRNTFVHFVGLVPRVCYQ